MTLKQLLIIVAFATAICWLVWFLILFKTDPSQNGLLGRAVFYGSLFFSLLGSMFLASFGWRKFFSKFSLEYRMVGTCFRQSFFLSAIIIGALFLASRDVLHWWNLLLLVLVAVIIEFLFISCRRPA